MRHSNPAMHNAYGAHILLATQFVGSGRVDENDAVPTQVLEEGHAELLTQILDHPAKIELEATAVLPR